MGYKAFLFDMDGTLVDNMGIHRQVWSEFLAGQGIFMTPAEFYAQAAGLTNAEILRKLIGPHLEEEPIKLMSAQKEELYRQRYRPIMRPLDGLPAFLRAARNKGVSMAVASSAPLVNIEFHLTGLRLRDYFDAVVGEEDVRFGKPHPDLFLTAAERLSVIPGECLVFEDTPTGLEAARRAGMRAVAFTTSYSADILLQSAAAFRAEPHFAGLSMLDFVE